MDDLIAIYPEGVKRLKSTRINFSCLLPEGDPRLEAILARLEEAGLKPWVDTSRMRDRAHEFILSKHREYDSEELESFEFLKFLASTYVKAGRRDERGRIKLGVDTLEQNLDIANPSLAGARYVVPDRIKERFESSGLRGLAFRPTVPRRDGGFGGPTTWKRADGPWWELTSDVTLPPLSPRMALTDGKGRPLRDGDYSRGVIPREGLYAFPELRYLASSMGSMPPFDLARTFEPIGANPTPEDGLLIASQRLYRFCSEHDVKAVWVPVRIDAD